MRPGNEIAIEHSISFRPDKADISQMITLPADELTSMREQSVAAEQEIYEKLCAMATDWEKLAANTLLLDKAIEYINSEPTEHSSNQWEENRYGNMEKSNMVYRMSYYIYEDKIYNPETQKRETAAWHLSWSVSTNEPDRDAYRYRGQKIAGQERKRFTDKAAMQKYLDGRIKAYSSYFTELSPTVPKDLAYMFMLNGQVLPGYAVKGMEDGRESTEKVGNTASLSEHQGSQKPSVIGQLAASKKAAHAELPEASKDKPKKSEPEL